MSSLMPSDLFRGQLVRLAAPHSDDKESMARWYDDPEFQRQLDTDPARPRPASYFEPPKEKANEYREFSFLIRTLAEDKMIGFTDLWVMWNHQTAWLSIGIGEAEYRGKGYGTDAMRLTLAYAFRELNLYRISLTVFSYNPRAIHVYEKLGFVREGVSRSALYRDGQRHDVILMGLLRPEWDATQKPLSE